MNQIDKEPISSYSGGPDADTGLALLANKRNPLGKNATRAGTKEIFVIKS